MMNEKYDICNAFNAHAQDYVTSAKVQHEIGQRLIERLQYFKIEPRYILDLGCGPGTFLVELKTLYPKAQIIGLDLAFLMLKQVQSRPQWFKKWPLINADMNALPFASGLFDLVFANQVLHWSNPMSTVLGEINRVMNTNGCLMFSSLGPDTFKELNQSFLHSDGFAHVNNFPDMHDVGDELLAQYFLDPVMDMERLTVQYPTLHKLLHTLKAQGVRNINPARNPGLTGKHAWKRFETAMADFVTADGRYPLSYEVVYGHAWKGTKHRTDRGVETSFSVAQLKATLR